MVVDRICLFIFTMFTIIATLAVLFSAPHIIVQYIKRKVLVRSSRRRRRKTHHRPAGKSLCTTAKRTTRKLVVAWDSLSLFPFYFSFFLLNPFHL
jgi:hypothetical protein